jgi:ribosomal protein L40E
MKCPACNKENYPRDKTCQHCDAPLHVLVNKESQAEAVSKTQTGVDGKICDRCGLSRNGFFFVSAENPKVCGSCRDELQSHTRGTPLEAKDAEVEAASINSNTCTECGQDNDRTARYCRKCNSRLDESSSAIGTTVATVSETAKSTDHSDSESKSDTTAQRSDSMSSGSFDLDLKNDQKIKRVFKWFLWGWVLFFVLGYISIDVKRGLELIMSLVLGVGAALLSTLIYWGIREFLKSNADKDRRADAAESEIAELRRKIDELSRKSQD